MQFHNWDTRYFNPSQLTRLKQQVFNPYSNGAAPKALPRFGWRKAILNGLAFVMNVTVWCDIVRNMTKKLPHA
ncbi:MAG: hypothetical protein CTY24_09640 [Methylobacter sp.]|nr:MAG: hypothetical protein CTY24_09640 [Methylobacter sp.]